MTIDTVNAAYQLLTLQPKKKKKVVSQRFLSHGLKLLSERRAALAFVQLVKEKKAGSLSLPFVIPSLYDQLLLYPDC
jgi:hypothetical protein